MIDKNPEVITVGGPEDQASKKLYTRRYQEIGNQTGDGKLYHQLATDLGQPYSEQLDLAMIGAGSDSSDIQSKQEAVRQILAEARIVVSDDEIKSGQIDQLEALCLEPEFINALVSIEQEYRNNFLNNLIGEFQRFKDIDSQHPEAEIHRHLTQNSKSFLRPIFEAYIEDKLTNVGGKSYALHRNDIGISTWVDPSLNRTEYDKMRDDMEMIRQLTLLADSNVSPSTPALFAGLNQFSEENPRTINVIKALYDSGAFQVEVGKIGTQSLRSTSGMRLATGWEAKQELVPVRQAEIEAYLKGNQTIETLPDGAVINKNDQAHRGEVAAQYENNLEKYNRYAEAMLHLDEVIREINELSKGVEIEDMPTNITGLYRNNHTRYFDWTVDYTIGMYDGAVHDRDQLKAIIEAKAAVIK